MNSNPSAEDQKNCAKRQIAPLVAMLGGLILLMTGCESEPESHVVSAPPPSAPVTVTGQQAPQTVVVTPAQTQPTGPVIIAQQAPPAAQTEVVTSQPTSEHKWIPGYWTWRNERYEWMAGHWELPPNRGENWIAPRWERLSDGTYRYYEGYWN